MHRSIILAKGGRYWIYQYIFAKKDRANIEDEELQDLRSLAKTYAALDDRQLIDLLESAALVEICHGDKDSV